MDKKSKQTPVKVEINFANEEAAKHFMLWLCESGEQDYWDWMEVREQEENGDITALQFHYEFKKLPLYQVNTECGRREPELED